MRTLLLLLLSALPLVAQQPPAAATPSDPVALLALARTLNGLEDPQLKPWHLKATVQLFDPEGKPEEKSTFEEFWSAPGKRKEVFTTPTATLTKVIAGGVVSHAGYENHYKESIINNWIARRILNPIMTPPANFKLKLSKKAFGEATLNCVIIGPSEFVGAYCFNTDKVILRSETLEISTLFNDVIQFQGRYVALNTNIVLKRPIVKIHLDSLTQDALISDVDFAPPPGSVTAPVQATKESGKMSAGYLLRPLQMACGHAPTSARNGQVFLSARISDDGRVHDAFVLSSPDPSLTTLAMDTIHKAVFDPFRENGKAISVDMHLTVKCQ